MISCFRRDWQSCVEPNCVTLSHRLCISWHTVLQISSEQQIWSQHDVADKGSAAGALATLAARHNVSHLPFKKLNIDDRQSKHAPTQVLRLETEVYIWNTLLRVSSSVKQQTT